MFCKSRRQRSVSDVFIPTAMRVVAIIQLCLVFTVLANRAGHPFMGELFAHKSQMLLYHTVMGNGGAIGERLDQKKELLDRNKERFAALPEVQKTAIIKQHDRLQSKADQTFLSKLQRSFYILAVELPPFEQAWIFFSLLIPMLVLLRVEGARQAAWLLPMIVLVYAINNRWNGTEPGRPADERLFPTEEYIVRNYLKEPLGEDISEQHDQLLRGWQLYLVDQWAHQKPALDSHPFAKQVEDGEYAFNVARVEAVGQVKDEDRLNSFHQKESWWMLILYIMWNGFFAWFMNRGREGVGSGR